MSVVAGRGAWAEARLALRGQRKALAIGFLLMLVNRVAAMALPASSKWVIDDVIGKQRSDLLPWLVAATGAAVVVEAGSAFGLSQLTGTASQRAVTDLRRRLFDRVLGLPMRFHDTAQTGASISRIMLDPEAVRDIAGSGMLGFASAVLTAALAFGMLFYLDAGLTVALLAVVLVYGAGVTLGLRRLYPAFRRVSEAAADLTGRIAESLGGIQVVKAHAAERCEGHLFVHESHQLLRRHLLALNGVSAFRATSTLATGVASVLLLTAGARAVIGDVMTIGEVVTYLFFASLLMMPIVQISATVSELGKAWAALGRIHDLKAMPTEREEDVARATLPCVAGEVRFHDVSYAYVPDRRVLSHVTLHAPAGSTVALVGPTGSGKSTICRLLAAFDRPTEGRILIDGVDLAGVRRRDFRKHLGAVLQETFLFDGTIADNIRYAAPGATDAQFRAAARRAHCEEFVKQLPAGYDTRVGERGVQLSGGQRQRLAIARALLRDPRILILDEATSNLDSESETLVQHGLRALKQGRTTFVITHRLPTARAADQILVMEQGTIVEQGGHEELLALDGRYARALAMQMRGERIEYGGAVTRVAVMNGRRPCHAEHGGYRYVGR